MKTNKRFEMQQASHFRAMGGRWFSEAFLTPAIKITTELGFYFEEHSNLWVILWYLQLSHFSPVVEGDLTMSKQIDCLVKQTFLQHKTYYTTRSTTSFSVGKERLFHVQVHAQKTRVVIKLHTFHGRKKEKNLFLFSLLHYRKDFFHTDNPILASIKIIREKIQSAYVLVKAKYMMRSYTAFMTSVLVSAELEAS